ncbi:MAG: alpha/beta hydrolase [Flavobacteriaceae bacterium]|nr:alpha/beta hydrolase [Flavobacteriaceae bacterium]
MIRFNLLLAFLFLSTNINAQNGEFEEKAVSVDKLIDGTLLTPKHSERPDLAIIIGGSGPTDRNGNQNFMQNNAIKKLAETLSSNGIASFRYDKRIVKQIRRGKVDGSIMFDDFVSDAVSALKYFKKSGSFDDIVLIGHGQGSLVGILASKSGVDGFVSIAGSGKSIDQVILEQVEKTAPMFTEDTKKVLETLKKGEITYDYPEALESIFSEDLQPFMANWMKYIPEKEIAELQIPMLIINGTKDLQVSTEEATNLSSAAKNSELLLIDKMNHIFVIIEGDDLENSKSYNESYRKISEELSQAIITFVQGL